MVKRLVIYTVIFFGAGFLYSCNSGKNDQKSTNTPTEQQADTTVLRFKGFAPVEDQLLKEPRKSNSGDISFYPEDPKFEMFVNDLKKWLSDSDKKQVAHHVFYPITLFQANRKVQDVHSAEEFIAFYSKFWTQKAKNIVLETQNAKNVYRDEFGYRLGTGEIWINKFKDDQQNIKYLITNINDVPAKLETETVNPAKSSSVNP